MMPQNQYDNASVVLSRVRQVIQKNKASDLFHKAFLRPQQIALKTWRTQKRQDMDYDSLPFGLKQTVKKDISLNKFVLQDFQSFEDLDPEQRNIQYIRENNYDNLISLLKPREIDGRIQICICICMYSQDKGMLRKTLAGVSNNIATFVQNGISADDIIVAVVMDGIEKVDPSVVDLFGQLQKQSNIYLDNEIQQMDPKQIAKDDFSEVDEQEVININGFIFDEFEYEDRKKRRFAERKRQYEEVSKMRKKIQMYEMNKKITYDQLDGFLKPFFLAKARDYYKKEYAEQDLEFDKDADDRVLKQYADNVRKGRPVIYQALSQAKSYCQKYIQTRESLALLNSFRVDITFGSFQKKQPKSSPYNKLSQQQSNSPQVKMNLLFITKYKNSGKLSSHNWFFNGLCRQIKTQYAILLDVGLCPDKTALYNMYNHMKFNGKCGGVCGYMNLRIQRLEDADEEYTKNIDWLSRLFLHVVDIQRAQQVQYHFAHLIDKPFQALFKFIHVLPGAFSAYRMSALQPSQQKDSQLMKQYFKSLQQSTSRKLLKTSYTTSKAILKVLLPDFLYNMCLGPKKQQKLINNQIKQVKELTEQQLLYNSNVYLAEDRTLCMGIHQNGYELDYLPDAHAWVDPIKHLHGLLGQRKRWINGSFFAFQAVKEVLSQQSKGDFCLKLQIFYLNLMNMLAFVSPALFLFTVHIAMFAFRDWFFGYILNSITSTTFQTTEFYNSFVFVMDFIYVMLMLGLVFKSMHFTHREEKFIPFVYGMSTVMGMFSIAVFLVLLVDMIRGIVDTFACTDQVKTNCITFLAQVPALRAKFFDALPGGLMTYIIYKWVVVGVIAMYIIPILVYAIFYCKCEFLTDVIFGVVSFIYYTPTYLNILNTFALCRIDDISWGTKGLDAEDTKNKDLKQSWKSIKILHIAKFLFWNIVVGAAMLVVSSPINTNGLITAEQYNQLMVDSYVRKFFMTFALMVVIGFTLLLKILLGAMYSIGYRCTHAGNKKKIQSGNNSAIIKQNAKTKKYFTQIKKSMDEQLREYIHGVVNNVNKKRYTKGIQIKNLNSLIIINKNLTGEAERKKQKQKWNKLVESQSKILKKEKKNQSLIKPKSTEKPKVPITLNLSEQNKAQSATMLREKQTELDVQSPVFNQSSNNGFKEVSYKKYSDNSKNSSQPQTQAQPSRLQPQPSKLQPPAAESSQFLSQPSKQSQDDSKRTNNRSKSKRQEAMESFMKSTNSYKKQMAQQEQKKEQKRFFGLF